MRKFYPALMGLLAILVGLAGCDLLPSIQKQTARQNADGEGDTSSFVYRFKRIKCKPIDLPLEMDCGYLTVPADHNNPQAGKMRLAVTILRAQGKETAADPVVFLPAGPGSSATADIAAWIDQPLLKKRDLILVDLRGSGASEPSLNCPEVENEAYPGDPSEPIRACHDRLAGAGVDLSLFNTQQIIADLNALRQALGYEAWNVLGVSTGARLALALVRDYPQGIRSVILDSAQPPEVNAYETRATNSLTALQALFASCTHDTQCAYAYPDLENLFYDLLASLDEKPVTLSVVNPITGERQQVYLDGRAMARLTYEALYHPETLARIPYVIYEIHYGRNEAIAGLLFPGARTSYYASMYSGEKKGLAESEGAYYSVECQDEVGFNQLDVARSKAKESGSLFAQKLVKDVEDVFGICNLWGSRTVNRVENEAVRSDIPSLILAGQYDPVTPPTWGQQTAKNLANSHLVLIPGRGHSLIETDNCSREIAAAFLKSPRQEPDTACLEQMNLEFWLP